MTAHGTNRPATTTDPDWTPPQQGQWTYDDYARLPDVPGQRYQLLDGRIYAKPSPNTLHQRAVGNLFAEMRSFVRQHDLGEVFVAPFDVMLAEDFTAVQPDIVFLSSQNRDALTARNVQGVPDLLVEVLWPSNEEFDRQTKYKKYLQCGVREYWIVDPADRRIEVFVRRDEFYAPLGKFRPGQRTRSQVLAGFNVAVEDICPI